MRYIDVVIDNKSEYTDSFFTYKAQDDIAVGDKVYVPFANRTKSSEGYVVKIDTLPKLDENKTTPESLSRARYQWESPICSDSARKLSRPISGSAPSASHEMNTGSRWRAVDRKSVV